MEFSIPALDDALAEEIKQKIRQKTKPPGSLGMLEQLALQAALIQGTLAPSLEHPQMLVFASDHGAAAAGVSAYPQEVTWQMVANFLAGGAAINVFARRFGLGLTVVDAGVAHDFGAVAGLTGAKLAHGTASFIDGPAMSRRQCESAIAQGRAIAHRLAASGCRVVGLGEMGIGNTASASLLTHCLVEAPLDEVIGRGTGLDDVGFARKRALLERALARGGRPREALDAITEYGGFEIAMLAGAMLGAAERRLLILIDGFIVTAALLAAHAIAPAVLDYCVFSHCSAEAGHARQLAHLGASPLLQLGLRLGEGTGAALAFPLLQAAVDFLNDMASFQQAGVSGRA
ncbi:MAG: nicotinate-nucleotide--dimethylbenzimidazole phosphoribosyltransferase [Rhodocyclaceae bacterium]|nr:nicotinate-nucleotide--dimethylbenzimidazole phosphoribosyltransferase [Rhodocyclaceae bacterium]